MILKIIKSVKKQKPKKPIEIGMGETTIARLCPSCGYDTFGDNKDNYCCFCGQAIDWGEENG